MTSSEMMRFKELNRRLEAARRSGNMPAMQEALASLTLMLRAVYG